ncbi:MAG: nucleoside 2-deoxyribosyltransferase [Bacteroidales bacterium]|nr:nucleoside 2-deoxyribosyltransferase [Bacteroidales bacterium]
MKIYFAGSISGGRADVPLYHKIITQLKIYGEVLTEFIGNAELSGLGEKNLSDEFIHDRDLEWLLSSDVVVAEITTPSLGVGYEIGRAIENGKKILCLYRTVKGKRISAMIKGAKGLKVKKYTDFEDIKLILEDFFK